MSTLSLNKLINGGGRSGNPVINMKFGNSNKFATLPSKSLEKSTGALNSNHVDDNRSFVPPPPTAEIRRRRSLQRPISLCNGTSSLSKNPFRGVKKEVLEKRANLLIHSMTVRSFPRFFTVFGSSKFISKFHFNHFDQSLKFFATQILDKNQFSVEF